MRRGVSLAILLTCLLVTSRGEEQKHCRPGPGPQFTVSEATTHITAPRTCDGLVDYATALNDNARGGVSAEANAGLLFLQAFGPEPDGVPISDQFFDRLGIARAEKESGCFISYEEYLHKVAGIPKDDERYPLCLDELKGARTRPWESVKYPNVAGWLRFSRQPLLRIVQGTRRTAYFLPIDMSRREPGASPALINALLPELRVSLSAARALSARALLLASEGRTAAAWNDLQATLRLGDLIGKGPTLVHGLAGIAVQSEAIDAAFPLIEASQPRAGLARGWLRDVNRLPPPPEMIQKVTIAERYTLLDIVQRLATGAMAVNELKPDGDERVVWRVLGVLALETVCWDTVMKTGNHRVDRIVKAMAIENPQQRHSALARLEQERMSLDREIFQRFVKDSHLDPLTAGEWLGHLLASAVLSNTAPQAAEDRIIQLRRNLCLALALAAHHSEQGCYPEKLDDLVPRFIEQVQPDIFGGDALHYQRTAVGYLLYSIGNNCRDDGGNSYDGESESDDLCVRMGG